MTEVEWLVCNDPLPMLDFLQGNAQDRKFRLFGVACCYHIWPMIGDERSRKLVGVTERYADGLASSDELAKAWRDTPYFEGHTPEPPINILASDAANYLGTPDGYLAAYYAAMDAVAAVHNAPLLDDPSEAEIYIDYEGYAAREKEMQARLLRDILGNPFRRVTIDPCWLAWNAGTVRNMAQAIYEERAFDQLAILADALEDAGSDNAELLTHCRGPGPHVRGCWVVDLPLGKG